MENMKINVGQNIRSLRHKRQVSQEDLAETMGVTVQAISKWETGKANPDLMLLPKLAEYFEVTIDNLFYINEEENMLTEDSAQVLENNVNWWSGILEEDLLPMPLPKYGFFTPTEDTLCLLGDVRGKNVLEIACGNGESLVWMAEKGARELWGLDISAAQIKKSELLLKKRGITANLFVSPMELNPGLPHAHFDIVFSLYGIGWSMDLEKTIIQISEYLKTGGKFVFSWDNPMMQCIASKDGEYKLVRSYVNEEDIIITNEDDIIHMHNWKLSTYLNCLVKHGFAIEQVVEESDYDEKEADIFREGKFYSADRAKLINNVFIVKARKV